MCFDCAQRSFSPKSRCSWPTMQQGDELRHECAIQSGGTSSFCRSSRHDGTGRDRGSRYSTILTGNSAQLRMRADRVELRSQGRQRLAPLEPQHRFPSKAHSPGNRARATGVPSKTGLAGRTYREVSVMFTVLYRREPTPTPRCSGGWYRSLTPGVLGAPLPEWLRRAGADSGNRAGCLGRMSVAL